MLNPKDVALLSGESHPELVKRISQQLGIPITSAIKTFEDGEKYPVLSQPVRGKRVFIIQSLYSKERHGDNFIEAILLIDAARRASAEKIYLVAPYFGYSRQDRKDRARAAIGSSAFIHLFESLGITGFITVDMHYPQSTGVAQIAFDNLFSSALFLPHISRHRTEYEHDRGPFVIGAPDAGAVAKCRAYSKRLKAGLAIANKYRPEQNASEVTSILQEVGTIKGRTVIELDDLIDTGGTLCESSDAFLREGAAEVFTYCSHPVFSDGAILNLNQSSISKIFITDTIPVPEEIYRNPKFEVIGVDRYLSEAIECAAIDTSLSDFFKFGEDYSVK